MHRQLRIASMVGGAVLLMGLWMVRTRSASQETNMRRSMPRLRNGHPDGRHYWCDPEHL